MDRFEQFNTWFDNALARAFPLIMLGVAHVFTASFLPFLVAAVAVGLGGVLVYFIRRRMDDISLASSAYVLLTIVVRMARS